MYICVVAVSRGGRFLRRNAVYSQTGQCTGRHDRGEESPATIVCFLRVHHVLLLYRNSPMRRLAFLIPPESRLKKVQFWIRFGRTSPASTRKRICREAAGWLMPSFSAMRMPQTPSLTRSPATCGGKYSVGFLSHSSTWRRGSLERAERMRVASFMIN